MFTIAKGRVVVVMKEPRLLLPWGEGGVLMLLLLILLLLLLLSLLSGLTTVLAPMPGYGVSNKGGCCYCSCYCRFQNRCLN